MTESPGIVERKQKIKEMAPFITATGFFMGSASFLYLTIGILFSVINLWFPQEVAKICGYEFTESDYTDIIHFVIGVFSIGLAFIGIWGMRDLVVRRKVMKAGVAVFFMLSYSCGVAMMPTSDYTPLVILGLCLLGMNFLSGFFIGYIVSELTI